MQNKKWPLIAAVCLAVLGVVLVAAGALSLGKTSNSAASEPQPAPRSAPQAKSAVPSAPQLPVQSEPPSTSPMPRAVTGGQQPPDPLAGPVSDEYLNAALRKEQPSDLPPALEQRVLSVAKQAVLADLTGKNRQEFPTYLPGPASPQWLYRNVRIQAAVASSYQGISTRCRATVLWAGTTPAGKSVDRQPVVIALGLRGGRWTPLAPTG